MGARVIGTAKGRKLGFVDTRLHRPELQFFFPDGGRLDPIPSDDA